MNIARAEQISGWMISSELEWLAQQASKHHNIVEVGCWQGRSTRALADNTAGTVYAVDTFLGSAEHQEELAQLPEGWLIERFMNNVGMLPNVHIMQMHSVHASISFAAKYLDMVFLDGAHDYESVKTDIIAWRPRIASGGLLCGHDFGDGCHGVGVKQAVRELVPDYQMGPNEIWFHYES